MHIIYESCISGAHDVFQLFMKIIHNIFDLNGKQEKTEQNVVCKIYLNEIHSQWRFNKFHSTFHHIGLNKDDEET